MNISIGQNSLNKKNPFEYSSSPHKWGRNNKSCVLKALFFICFTSDSCIRWKNLPDCPEGMSPFWIQAPASSCPYSLAGHLDLSKMCKMKPTTVIITHRIALLDKIKNQDYDTKTFRCVQLEKNFYK